jgi:hypothetical protein
MVFCLQDSTSASLHVRAFIPVVVHLCVSAELHAGCDVSLAEH